MREEKTKQTLPTNTINNTIANTPPPAEKPPAKFDPPISPIEAVNQTESENPRVREVETTLPLFVYVPLAADSNIKKEKKGTITLETGVKYTGEWYAK